MNTSSNSYFLDFHRSNDREGKPAVRVSVQRGQGIVGVDPLHGLTPSQQHKLNTLVKGVNRRGMYGSVMDAIIERGLDGECGFEPDKKRIYFVSGGDKPVDEFFKE